MVARSESPAIDLPDASAVLELCKPITWFPPSWAFLCGAVSSGAALAAEWPLVLAGLFLCGPLVCGMSQAANDWCDRFVDAINQPDRPVPSGRVPARWALGIALGMFGLALLLGAALGLWAFAATAAAVAAAWAYSAEPVRLKRSGLLGPGLVGLCYEGLPWFTGAAVLAGALPTWEVVVVALLYAAGAHGIMTLNDFKAVAGDRATGIRSLPATLGPDRAARVACLVMAIPQLAVVLLLAALGRPWHALVVLALLAGQALAMRRLLGDPMALAPWYNATGVSAYVTGMMVAALALRGVAP